MIIALISKKGGVGKTTTTVNLGAALAEMGRTVLLVDLDNQASASLSLGFARGNLAPSTADLLLSSVPIQEVIRTTSTEGLDLVTGSVDLLSTDSELGQFHDPKVRLRQALQPVEDSYDYILLDCPGSLSLISVNALVAADGFLVPVMPHFLAIEGIRNLLAYAERLRRRWPDRAKPLGLVLTLVDYRSRASRENVDGIRQEYGHLVFGMEIRVNVRLAEAPSLGKTIYQHDPGSTGAQAYRLLAEELVLRTEPAPVPALVEVDELD